MEYEICGKVVQGGLSFWGFPRAVRSKADGVFFFPSGYVYFTKNLEPHIKWMRTVQKSASPVFLFTGGWIPVWSKQKSVT